VKRRTLLSFALASVATSALLFAACTFPEVSFAPSDAAANDSATNAHDAAIGPDTGAVDPDGVKQDAASRDGGVTRPEAGPDGEVQGCGGTGGTACDCDNDKVNNSSCGAKPADCDDFDPLIHPNAEFVAAKWDPSSPHTPVNDWNCDGTVTKQYSYNVNCGLLGNCSAQGFSGDPGCGESGTYVFCKPAVGGLSCVVDKTETRTQGCR
jgi:hypothetical protein